MDQQINTSGYIELSDKVLSIIAPKVEGQKYQYALDYKHENSQHLLDVSFDRLSIDNTSIKKFQSHSTSLLQNNLLERGHERLNKAYYFLPLNFLEEIGNVKLNIHSKQSLYGIRDLGVLDAAINFNKNHVRLNDLTIVGENLNLHMTGIIPNRFNTQKIVGSGDEQPMLSFSIIDSEFNILPQMAHHFVFENNLLARQILPNKGPLKINGQLINENFSDDFRLNVAGKLAESDISINADINLTESGFVQQNLQLQLSDFNASNLLNNFGLTQLIDSNGIGQSDIMDGIIKLTINQNPDKSLMQDVKLIVSAFDQEIELTAQKMQSAATNLSGDLKFNINDIGMVFRELNLSNGQFNQLAGLAKYDGKVSVVEDHVQLVSDDVQFLNTQFTNVLIDIADATHIKFNGTTNQLKLQKLLNLLASEGQENLNDIAPMFDGKTNSVLNVATKIFNNDSSNINGYHLNIIKNINLGGELKVAKLYLTKSIYLEDASIKIDNILGEENLKLQFNGQFLNRPISGVFHLKSVDDQLKLDFDMQAFSLDIGDLAVLLNVKHPHIIGQADINFEATGEGFSMGGLMSNLSGFIDIDMKQLGVANIDSIGFNKALDQAFNERQIDMAFKNLINPDNSVQTGNNSKILPEKLTVLIRNGLGNIAQPIQFLKPGSRVHNGMFVAQIDFTNDVIKASLQFPLADDETYPNMFVEFSNNDTNTQETLNVEDLQAYYKVKLLEKNVNKLEALQKEIKRKNDAEIARYNQEKSEAAAFKVEIKDRVMTAIAARKLREIAAAKPPAPLPMPYLFILGTDGLAQNNPLGVGFSAALKNNSISPTGFNIKPVIIEQLPGSKNDNVPASNAAVTSEPELKLDTQDDTDEGLITDEDFLSLDALINDSGINAQSFDEKMQQSIDGLGETPNPTN